MVVGAFLLHKVRTELQAVVSRLIQEGRRQITILQSLRVPILSKVLILVLGTITIPFILALTLSILLTLVFAIPGVFMCISWLGMFASESPSNREFGKFGNGVRVPDTGDMKIPTFYAEDSYSYPDGIARTICLPVVGGVFGGIHCIGWFLDFPSSAEAILWRVSSAVLTGIAFLSSIIVLFLDSLYKVQLYFGLAVSIIIILVYVVSRLLLIVEAFIALRHLTPGMLELVKWTSFIPHI